MQKRRQSETSVGSNRSDNIPLNSTSSHIIVHYDSSCQVNNTRSLQDSSLDLYENIGPLVNTSASKSDIAVEAVICSCQICTFCHKVIYDEEVMGAWSADDSNLNIM